jgi:hypothetical protein
MTEVNYTAVLAEAFHKPVAAERVSGCGRVYVAVTTPDKFKLAAVKKAAKKLGKIFQTRSHYGDRNAIYIGYDNATGVELARGTAVVEALKAAGVECYRNEHGD